MFHRVKRATVPLGLIVAFLHAIVGFGQEPRFGHLPLVTLLARLDGATKPEGNQWVTNSQTISTAIPDDSIGGVRHPGLEIVTVDVGNGNCQDILDVKVAVSISHPRPADLVLTLSTLSRVGQVRLGSATLWDGPQWARDNVGKNLTTIPDADQLTPWGILNSLECAKWRLDAEDRATGQTGKLLDWTLRRRTALNAVAAGHDVEYYRKLLFGLGSGDPNVHDYFLEASRGAFTFANARILQV